MVEGQWDSVVMSPYSPVLTGLQLTFLCLTRSNSSLFSAPGFVVAPVGKIERGGERKGKNKQTNKQKKPKMGRREKGNRKGGKEGRREEGLKKDRRQDKKEF